MQGVSLQVQRNGGRNYMDKIITLKELRNLAKNCNGEVYHIYLHWTAGRYDQTFDDYHICITGDAQIHLMGDLDEYKEHTWHRNSNAIGVTLCGCFDASAYADGNINFGSQPPTAGQIETMAKVVTILCENFNIPIDANHVMTHAEAADLDDYGPATTCERWDLWKLYDIPGDGKLKPGGDVIRGKAIWFQNYPDTI